MKKYFSILVKAALFSCFFAPVSSWSNEDHGHRPGQILKRLKDHKRLGKKFNKYNLEKSHRALRKRSQQNSIHQNMASAPSPEDNLRGLEISFDKAILKRIRTDRPQDISFQVQTPDGPITLDLFQEDVTRESFVVTDDKGRRHKWKEAPIFYRGSIQGKDESIASFSIFSNRVIGVIHDGIHRYNIGNMESPASVSIPLNPNSDAESESSPSGEIAAMIHDASSLPQPGKSCADEEPIAPVDSNMAAAPVGSDFGTTTPVTAEAMAINTNILSAGIYFVADYDLYLKNNSSIADTTAFITGMFNQVATLYANEGIAVHISGIKIYTSTDPFATATSSSAQLTSFGNLMYSTPFPGALAHLLSTKFPGYGGIAYVGGVCQKSSGYGVSNIYNTYSVAPTYSWTVEVVTHELGHNFGSKHTHWAGWTGGPIDGCYACEPFNGTACTNGPVPPAGGGTIMSYCHIKYGVGINLANGFGPQPGNAIRATVAAAACLQKSYVADTTAPTVTLTSPAAGATVSGSVDIFGVGTDNKEMSGIVVKIDGVSTGSISGSASGTTFSYYTAWDSTKVLNGSHTISVQAFDAAANASTVLSRQVTVSNAGGGTADTTPPTVAFSAPAASASVSGTITLTATASDSGSGIKSIQFYNGTTPIGSAGATSPYSITYNTDTLAVGTLSLKVTAIDNAGNSASSTRSFTHVDVTAPTISLSAPLANAVLSGTVTLSATAADTGGSGMSKVDFYRGTTLIASDTTSPYSVNLNTTTLSDGAYSLKARAYDKSGNFTDSTVISVQVKNTSTPVVDSVAPTIQLVSHSSGEKILAWSANVLTADVADDSGVSKVEFLINGTVVCTITSGAYECPFATSQRKKSFTIQVRATDNSSAKNVGTISTTLSSE